jgi:PhoPQ-activated pathogenicity-related protein
VIIPKNLKYTNVSHAYLTGYCNSKTDPDQPVNPYTETDVLQIDELAHNSHQPIILVKQIPNCPLVYAHDPTKRQRAED